ncbi:MAG: hypothetical protein M3Y80_03740 [Verrucomicrobiota bacterium]|nr:hypothetical protein [Verrucomicrobiota bacterium]
MLAQILNPLAPRAARFLLLTLGVSLLASCATKPEPQLVSNGVGRESAIPWNQQEKWENQGQLGAMADHLQSR